MFIGLVHTIEGRSYVMEFDTDTPLFNFAMEMMPPEIECVEILSYQVEA